MDENLNVYNPVCSIVEDASKHHFKIVHINEREAKNPHYMQINVVYIARKPQYCVPKASAPVQESATEVILENPSDVTDEVDVTKSENITEVNEND